MYFLSIIIHSRKMLLFQNSGSWVRRKYSNKVFDVPMGYYIGVDIYELLIFFILSQLVPVIDKIGVEVYADLGIFQ